ncbi:MAG: ABC transporter permease, partial [Bacteroidales bacterium]|nr:ABC transporter permease [Bacteroidales bacterium]
MDASRFIARKLSFQGKLATAAVAVSFLVMMVAVAVSQGFRESVRDGAARMTGDLRIQPRAMQEAETTPMPRNPKGLEQIMELPGVKAVSPVAARAGIVKNGDLIHGVMIKGVERADSALHVSIPGRLSKILGVGVGDRLTTWFVGESLKARNFTVSEIHSDLLELDDNLLVYARLEDIQRLNGWDPDEVSCLEISVDRSLRSRAALDRLADEAGA